MSDNFNIVKGTRVRARWLQNKPFGTFSLAGVQMKTTGHMVEVVGTCRHFRGDDPVKPKVVCIYLDVESVPDGVQLTQAVGCNCVPGHIEIRSEWICEVLP